MKRSRRELSIVMVVDMGIFKNNRMTTLIPCCTFIPATGMGLHVGISFFRVN